MAFMWYGWKIIIKLSLSLASEKKLSNSSVQCIQYEINLQHFHRIPPIFNAANDDKMFTTKRPFIATIHGFADKETRPTRNPKITALFDEIMNDYPPGRDMDIASQKSLPPNAGQSSSKCYNCKKCIHGPIAKSKSLSCSLLTFNLYTNPSINKSWIFPKCCANEFPFHDVCTNALHVENIAPRNP